MKRDGREATCLAPNAGLHTGQARSPEEKVDERAVAEAGKRSNVVPIREYGPNTDNREVDGRGGVS
jgi:hypothetical protein